MKKLVVYLSILLMAGCAVNKKPDTETYPSGLIFPLEIAERHVFPGMNAGRIAVREGRLYITTREGWLYCLNQETGKEVWSHQIQSSWGSPPYLGESGIYAVSQNNLLRKLNYTGEEMWDIAVGGSAKGGILEDSGVVYFSSGSMLEARGADDKDLVWSFETGGNIRSTPRIFQDHIFFGNESGILFVIDRNGKEAARFESGGEIQDAVAVEGRRVYFGSADKYIYSVDWKEKKIKWKVKTGGGIFAPIALGKKNLYLTSGNNVLYCYNKKNGTMKWWRKIPSRTTYSPLLTPDKVVVASASPKLLGFEKLMGGTAGEFTAPQEIKSNPVWNDPYLLVTVFYNDRDESELLFLKKAVYVAVETTQSSPQTVNQNIDVTARAVGFHLPQYEFSLQRFVPLSFGCWPVLFMPVGKSAEVIQPFSEESSWAWFPEKSGAYKIIVKAKDAKENAQNQVYYLILPAKGKSKKGEKL
jgi:outer membrane protein assembly factor BamB